MASSIPLSGARSSIWIERRRPKAKAEGSNPSGLVLGLLATPRFSFDWASTFLFLKKKRSAFSNPSGLVSSFGRAFCVAKRSVNTGKTKYS